MKTVVETQHPKTVPAAKKFVFPCPQCGAGYPVVQAMRECHGRKRVLINVCTRCGIEGTITARKVKGNR